MSFLSRASTAFSGNSSFGSSKGTASASPVVNKASSSHDVEACRSECETTTQEPSVTEREATKGASLSSQIGPYESLLTLKRFWRNTLMFVLSITFFWRKEKLDDFWSELPEKIQVEDLRNYAPGIPQLAAFINSDDDFCVWRSFGQLHSRVLMQKNLELNVLEKQLNELDAQDNLAPGTRYRLQIGEHRDGWDTTQKDLITKIEDRLVAYDDLLLKYHTLKSIPKPLKSNYENLLNYIWKKRPLYEGHFDFAFKIQDFVRLGLRPQNEQFHDKLVRWISRWSGSPLNKLFRDSRKPTDASVEFYSNNRFELVTRSFITFLIISILMVPIFLLFLVPMTKPIMAVVVLVSSFVFTVSLSLFRDSRPQDIFFGTATYCAVLLVFLAGQNNLYTSTATGT